MIDVFKKGGSWIRLAATMAFFGGMFFPIFSLQAEGLVLTLSTQRVAITSNYTGQEIVIFGAIERDSQTVGRIGPYDMVITMRGPRQSLVVRRKEPVGPLWINRTQQKFVSIPSVLAVYSSRPLADVTSIESQQRLRLGLAGLVASPHVTLDRGQEDDIFRAALIRLKRHEGHFMDNEQGVTFLGSGIFRAVIPLPATAPTGLYEVEAQLFADSVQLASRTAYFDLVKTGFEQSVATYAQDLSLIYGFIIAITALVFGWLANIAFRRD
jgi:uncharacterized protein (TIGR02186 family)